MGFPHCLRVLKYPYCRLESLWVAVSLDRNRLRWITDRWRCNSMHSQAIRVADGPSSESIDYGPVYTVPDICTSFQINLRPHHERFQKYPRPHGNAKPNENAWNSAMSMRRPLASNRKKTVIALHTSLTIFDTHWRDKPSALAVLRSLPSSLR